MNRVQRQIRGVIFDLDGTLLDSREARVSAWSQAFRTEGIEVPDEELRPLIGLPGEALASRYSDDPHGIEAEEERVFSGMLQSVGFFPDAKPTIKSLIRNGLGVAIVTSSRRELLNRIDLPAEIVVCIDDVSSGKPDPESYLLAADRMNVDIRDILVVGDAENDMIPCMKTGSVCVFFRNGRDMSSENSHFYVDSISEVAEIVKKINGKAANGSTDSHT